MKLIPTSEADNYWLLPIWEADEKFKREPRRAPFPNMRASETSLVFSFGYMVAMTNWWREYTKATGLKYEPGSGECEAGTKIFIGHLNEAVQVFRGTGPVAMETLDAAREQGVPCPTERLGDFLPEVRELRIEIPAGLDVSGVTDGGHSTPAWLVELPDGTVVAYCWEWQNFRWVEYAKKVAAGVIVRDNID